MIGGEDEHHRIVGTIDAFCGECNGGTSIAADRFGDDVALLQRWERFAHQRQLGCGNHHVDIFEWDEWQESVNGGGEKRLPTNEWDEGLRAFGAAERPEARPSPARQDHRVRSRAHSLLLM